MSVRLDDAIPILRIFDETKAREFYLGFLGFGVDWEHRFSEDSPLYMQISRGALRFHLSEHHGDASPGARVFVTMHGIEELHEEFAAKDYKYSRPGINRADWGREITVPDPFGNRITFCELHRSSTEDGVH